MASKGVTALFNLMKASPLIAALGLPGCGDQEPGKDQPAASPDQPQTTAPAAAPAETVDTSPITKAERGTFARDLHLAFNSKKNQDELREQLGLKTDYGNNELKALVQFMNSHEDEFAANAEKPGGHTVQNIPLSKGSGAKAVNITVSADGVKVETLKETLGAMHPDGKAWTHALAKDTQALMIEDTVKQAEKVKEAAADADARLHPKAPFDPRSAQVFVEKCVADISLQSTRDELIKNGIFESREQVEEFTSGIHRNRAQMAEEFAKTGQFDLTVPMKDNTNGKLHFQADSMKLTREDPDPTHKNPDGSAPSRSMELSTNVPARLELKSAGAAPVVQTAPKPQQGLSY